MIFRHTLLTTTGKVKTMNMLPFSKLRYGASIMAVKTLALLAGILLLAMSGSVGAANIDIAPIDREKMHDTTDYYNIKVPSTSLALSFSSSFTVGWDSNIGRSGYASNPGTSSGWYMQPGLSMGVYWPLTRFAKLHTSVGIAYRYFPDGSGKDDFILSGDGGGLSTGIEAELKIGQNGKLTIGDNISRTIDSLQFASMSTPNGASIQNYSATLNEIFAQYDNDLRDDLHAHVRYAHNTAWYTPDTYKGMNYQSDMLDALLLKDLTKGWSVGPYGTATTTYYSEKDPATNQKHNDSTDLRLGVAFRHIGNITLDGRVGVQFLDFKTSNGITEDSSSVAPVYRLNLTFKTGEYLTHTFAHSYERTSAYRGVRINYAGMFTTSYLVNYRIHQNVDLGGDISWINTSESNGGVNADLIRIGGGPTFHLSQNTSFGMRYEYTKNLSNSSSLDYDRHLVTATITHKF